MTIEKFTQIYADKVTVTPRLNGTWYLLNAKDGYCILTPENIVVTEELGTIKTYKYSVLLTSDYDWSTIQIVTVDSLGEGDRLADAGIDGPTVY